jgi:hypothetical protein
LITELMPPVALSGVSDGSVSRKAWVASQLEFRNVLLLNDVVLHGPFHA